MIMSYIRNTLRTSIIHLLAAATMFTSLRSVAGHGRLMDPPARNSMWRLGFSNPVNYNDNELYCGGRVTQWARNKGKCGVCGDPYHNLIKDHEVGGKYANGIITREFTQGGTIEIIVHITANHKGYFEFRICPVEDAKVEVTQECLDTHLMPMASGEGSRYFLPEGKSNQFFNVSVQLPDDVTCKQCVVQWKYRTGNTWDKDESGKFCVGCGPQEEFYNCADVTIHPRGKSVEGQQTANSKPLIQNGRRESSPNVDRLHKMEDTGFSGTNDNLKTAASNTISEYGKQKVHLMQKLEGNRYAPWGEPKSTEVKPSNGSPFAHLARKSSESSGREISNNLRFGYLGDGYLNQSPVTRAQPDQVSGSAWKAGVSDSTQVDRIRRRFGYSISSTRENRRNNSSAGIQGHTTHKVNGISVNVISTGADYSKNDHIYSRKTTSHGPRITETSSHSRRADVTAIPRDNSKLHRKDGIDIDNSQRDVMKATRTTPKEQDNFLQKWKLQKLGRIAALRASQSKHIPGNKKARFWHTSATRNPVTQPLMTRNPVTQPMMTRNPGTQPMRTRNPVTQPMMTRNPGTQPMMTRNPGTQPMMTRNPVTQPMMTRNPGTQSMMTRDPGTQPMMTRNPKTQPMITMTRVQTGNSPTPVILSTRPPQESREFGKQRMGSNIYSSVTDTYTTSPKPQLNNQHSHARKQLPAWLVTALRIKESETDNRYKTGRVNSHQNFKTEMRKLVAKSNARNELLKSLFRPELTGVSQGLADSSLTTISTDTNRNRQLAHTSGHSTPADFSHAHRGHYRKDINTPSDAESSDLSYKDTRDGDNTGTESLVRHIVSLLISHMKDDDSNEYTGKLGARNKSMSGDVLLSTVAPSNTIVKNTISGGDTWFFHGPVSASTTKHYPSSNAIVNYQKKSIKMGTMSNTEADQHQHSQRTNTEADQHQHSQRKQDNLPPSVRGEVRAFNGLVLGSDYGNNQRMSRNQVEKYHNWRTAGLFDKHDHVNAQSISKQIIPSGSKDSMAGNGNNVHQNIYHSRPEYKDMRNDKQPGELWLRSEVQETPETPIDPHQRWSIRAGRRRDHYTRQQDFARSELICESVVVLSGGMDRWCTDNCNANFCPSSLCVCTVKAPAGSPRLMDIPLAIPRKHAWTHSKQHSGALPRQHSPAVAHEGVVQGVYTPTDMNSRNDRYITATRTAITKFPQHQTRDNERSYDKIHRNHIMTQAPATKLLHSFSHEANKDKMSLYLEKLLGQNTNFLQSRAEKIDSFKSTKTEPNYLLHSIGEAENQKVPYTFNGVQQKGSNNQFSNYHINGDHVQLPQIAPNDANSRFHTLQQIPELPQRLNWYTHANSYNQRKTSHPALQPDNHGNRARVSLQPYTSHGHSLNHGVLTNKASSNSEVYNIQETTGPIYYDQKPIVPHVPSVEAGVSTRAGYSRLICKAIGAFAGVRHFEEWCLSTCLTTMCPLTVCSCEQQSTHDLLHGR